MDTWCKLRLHKWETKPISGIFKNRICKKCGRVEHTHYDYDYKKTVWIGDDKLWVWHDNLKNTIRLVHKNRADKFPVNLLANLGAKPSA